MFTLTLGRKIIFLVQDGNQVILKKKSVYKVESRYNEPLYNEVIGITNNVLYLSNSKVYTLFFIRTSIFRVEFGPFLFSGQFQTGNVHKDVLLRTVLSDYSRFIF